MLYYDYSILIRACQSKASIFGYINIFAYPFNPPTAPLSGEAFCSLLLFCVYAKGVRWALGSFAIAAKPPSTLSALTHFPFSLHRIIYKYSSLFI